MAIASEQSAIKAMFKESLVEALHENKLLFEEVFTDVIEEIGLSEAIRQGRETEIASSEEVLKILQHNS